MDIQLKKACRERKVKTKLNQHMETERNIQNTLRDKARNVLTKIYNEITSTAECPRVLAENKTWLWNSDASYRTGGEK